MTTKMQRLGAWFGQHAKAIVGGAGGLATWAVTYYPSNHQVQLIAGLVGVLGTYIVVHTTPNQPAPLTEGLAPLLVQGEAIASDLHLRIPPALEAALTQYVTGNVKVLTPDPAPLSATESAPAEPEAAVVPEPAPEAVVADVAPAVPDPDADVPPL